MQRLRQEFFGRKHESEELRSVQVKHLCKTSDVQVKKMKEQINMQLIKVRGRLKWKVNIVKGNRIIGFIKPVEEF